MHDGHGAGRSPIASAAFSIRKWIYGSELRGRHLQCDSYNILSPHCNLRYDAGCRATHLIAHAVKVVLSRCSVITTSNDGALIFSDSPSSWKHSLVAFKNLEQVTPFSGPNLQKIRRFINCSCPVPTVSNLVPTTKSLANLLGWPWIFLLLMRDANSASARWEGEDSYVANGRETAPKGYRYPERDNDTPFWSSVNLKESKVYDDLQRFLRVDCGVVWRWMGPCF